MPDSDDDYVQDGSDDDTGAHQVGRDGKGTRSQTKDVKTRGGGGFEVTRTWENVVEGADGTISGAIEGLLEAGKRRRLLKDTTPLQRGIIRHLIVIIDLSASMVEKDLRPTRHLLTVRYTSDFVTEYFEQNPISQLGIIGMRDGLAVRVSDMSGNPNDHITALQSLKTQDPQGQASLQNGLEMARGALFHAPSHGTREILLIMGSLLSADPGDIHITIAALVKSHITCTVIGLAAEVAICRTLVTRTNPGLSLPSNYAVALNEQHYRELIMATTTPPPSAGPVISSNGTSDTSSSIDPSAQNSLLMMGFPSRIVEAGPSLCACHSIPTRGGYLCSRCRSKVCALPASCPACSLTLILSTHLARSYHHLFPLQNWAEVSWLKAAHEPIQSECFSCLAPFPELPSKEARRERKMALLEAQKLSRGTAGAAGREGGVSESGRYECGNCRRLFCIDCDVFAHEVVHNCPGCQSREGALMEKASTEMQGMEV